MGSNQDRRQRRWIYSIGLTAMIVTSLLLVSQVRVSYADIGAAVFAAGPNCGECITQCPVGHAVQTTGESGSGYVGLHECGGEGGCQNHGECYITAAPLLKDVGTLYAAVRSAPAEQLDELVASFGAGVRINRQRMAVQVDGCGGGVAVSIPLTDAQVAALDD